jgi:hypothetical protein
MPRPKTTPAGFNSLAEYEGYVRCAIKSKPGTEFEIYTHEAGVVANCITNYTAKVCLIGKRPDDIDKHDIYRVHLLFGSSDDRLGFWPLIGRSSELAALENGAFAGNHKYAYWWYQTNVRIKKITR